MNEIVLKDVSVGRLPKGTLRDYIQEASSLRRRLRSSQPTEAKQERRHARLREIVNTLIPSIISPPPHSVIRVRHSDFPAPCRLYNLIEGRVREARNRAYVERQGNDLVVHVIRPNRPLCDRLVAELLAEGFWLVHPPSIAQKI